MFSRASVSACRIALDAGEAGVGPARRRRQQGRARAAAGLDHPRAGPASQAAASSAASIPAR